MKIFFNWIQNIDFNVIINTDRQKDKTFLFLRSNIFVPSKNFLTFKDYIFKFGRNKYLII